MLRSAHPARQGAGGKRLASERPAADLSSKCGMLAHLDVNQSRLSSETRNSGGVGSISPPKVKYVNLQALIDREIILDQMLQNFRKGQSITELSI